MYFCRTSFSDARQFFTVYYWALTLKGACAVMNDMDTFDQAGIDDGYLEEIRRGDSFTVQSGG